VAIITNKSPEALDLLRHSAAHILAHALEGLYPGVEFGVGPAIENGFYYDVKLDQSIGLEDLEAIEARMAEIVAAAEPFSRQVLSRQEALELFSSKGQDLKCELIEALPEGEAITAYTIGTFTDLCRGPHIPDTSKLGAFKLTKLSGAYWKGDAEREQLQRIYGTAFFDKKELEEYLRNLEEAEKRDHRKLGRELGIYVMDPLAGVGLPLYLPNGARIIRTMQEWLRRDLYARGYQEVITPHIYNADVWKTSGHYDFYHDNMYFFQINEGDDESPRFTEYAVKPMNCPGHVLLYKSDIHSYRDLPLRYFEFGTVYRHEMSGVVHGLLRARGFTQDDAHVFCRRDQVVDEVVAILGLVDHIMSTFGFSYQAEISTRPEKSIGTDDMWAFATQSLMDACARHGLAYDINEGDGAFYGPKIDIKVKDAIGRTWQCSTVQVDFNFPERFGLTYRTDENTEERPWMLHRAIFGSIERFLGILIEHYAGALPLWLAPVQVAVLPLADRHVAACEEIAAKVVAAGGRAEVYGQNEPMRVKVAKAQSQKIPYMLVIGDKELESNTVSVRDRHEGDLGAWELQKLIDIIHEAALQ
ncbi:MAG: threonine--tRNA ligase, partial [Eggerthellaceae bacterium]|nr:threonine--tRNA ligase [Eggerthellaceae bacterium]